MDSKHYMVQLQILDMNTLTWSKAEQKHISHTPTLPEEMEVFYSLPPCAGHSLVCMYFTVRTEYDCSVFNYNKGLLYSLQIKWENKLLAVAGHSKHLSDTVVGNDRRIFVQLNMGSLRIQNIFECSARIQC